MLTTRKINLVSKFVLLLFSVFCCSISSFGQCPTASFYGDDGDGNTITCLMTIDTTTSWPFTFYNNSLNGISYEWDFGDGTPVYTTSSIGPVNHTYHSYGTFTVTLTVSNSSGCTDVESTIVIFEKNVVSSIGIPLSETGGCVPHTVNPNNNSENAVIFEWDFGDGTPIYITGSSSSPGHTYTEPGCYTLTLVARNTCNSTTATFSPIQVVDIDSSVFSVSKDTACVGELISFSNGTTPLTCGGAPNVSYNWILDDTSFGSNIPPQLLDIGSHTAMLVSCNLCGCDTASSQILIDTLPSASISINSTTTDCSPLTFSSTATASSNMTSHVWSIDGVPTYYVEDMPDHLFINSSNTTEIHTVRYTGTGFCGVFDTVFNITVYPGVIADFTPKDPEICTGGSIQFTDLSSGNALTYSWDFGNGQTSTSAGPHVITYANPGIYSVELIVDGSCGSDTMTTNVYVNDNPSAAFTMFDTICRGTCLVMNNQSINAISYIWNAPGSIPPSSSIQNPTFCYNTPGNYQVTLIAYSNAYCADTLTKDLVVHPFPFASFTYNNVCLGDTTFFNNNSTIATDFHWDFGDGDTSHKAEPFHVYSSPGSYTVVLTANNQFDCPSSRVHTVIVDSVPAVVASVPEVCRGDLSVFSDLTAGNISNWYWDFGDGDTSVLQSPVHIYAAADTYNVSLSVTTITGCSSFGTTTAIVRPEIISTISGTPDVCLGNPVLVNTTNSSTNIINSIIDFGDGTVVNDTAATHIYGLTGVFNVKYISEDDIGCTDTVDMFINVHPAINANFTYNDVCVGDTMKFTDYSSGPVVAWEWDFGDGDNSFDQYPEHLYSNTGNYKVLLTITSVSGCTDTLSKVVMVSPRAFADFSVDSVCTKDTSTFINLSANSNSYMWYFGDASSDTAANPFHIYQNPGTYSVILFASNNYGCSDTMQKQTYIYPIPDAGFITTTVCLGATTNFNDTSSAAISWSWDFGDSAYSSNQHPSHQYLSAGTYTVFLTVTNSIGCKNTDSSLAIVNPIPSADFTFNPRCVNQPVQFTDMSGALAVAWYWDFGDGHVDSTQNPLHIYDSIGSYNVSLIIKPGVSCYDTIVKTIDIQAEPTITASHIPVCLGDTFRFSSVSTGNIIDWLWDFGDGNIDTVQNPEHLYTGDGNFNVTVTGYNNLGCVAKDTVSVEVIPYITSGITIADICFKDTAFIQGNTNSSTAVWNWDLGDGSFSSVSNPVHRYNSPGDYVVDLTVTDALGCVSQSTDTIHVAELPVANFTPDTTCSGNPSQFFSLSTGIGTLNHQWNFGGNVFSFSDTTSFTFGTPGTHQVTLRVISSEGCVDDTTKDVMVLGGFLVSYTSDTVCLGYPTTFTNLSPVLPDSGFWIFGDGNSIAGGQSVQHFYQNSGIYITSLEAYWKNGCSDQRYNLTHVYDSVHAEFDFNSSNFCEQEFVQFVNQSSGGFLQYEWHFGDGTTSTAYAPAHLYSSVGNYTVKLIASNSIGCSDTFSRTITVNPTVTADFQYTVACPGEPIQFTETSTNASNYFWDFGDNNYSTVQNPTHTYGVSTSYNVTYIARSNNGCSDTVQKLITILPEVIADFSPVTNCGLDPINFSDQSTGNPVIWQWDFGGPSSNLQNPTYTFDSSGSYPVKLIVENSSGCVDSVVRNISIYSVPVAEFIADTVCQGSSTSFTNFSQDENPMVFQWHFGDSSAPVYAINPKHIYNGSGIYPVSVIASNIYGCKDTMSRNILVTSSITALFKADTSCLGTSTSFQNLSSAGVGSVVWNFGDGYGQSSAFSPVYKYNAPGTYNVTLTVNAFSGCSSTYTDSILVNSVPQAAFSFDNPCVGESISFNDTIFSNGISCAVWDFGDGSPQMSGSDVNHTYQHPGNYNVNFRVCNSAGCEVTVSQTVNVNPVPAANFMASDACHGSPTQFDNLTPLQSNMSYHWDFGDNNISNVPKPNYTYSNPGTYLASLTATNGYGCSDRYDRQVIVLDNPDADFIADTVCLGEHTNFTSLNNTGVTEYIWNFGDNQIGNTGTPSIDHMYVNPGIYFATLTVTNNGQCSDYTSKTIYVKNSVQSEFLLSDTIVCLGTSIDAINMTLAGNVDQWVWDLGDSTIVNTQNIMNYKYQETGLYSISLHAQGNFCSYPRTQEIMVIENTNTIFSADNVCLGSEIQFKNYSSQAISYDWNFGDGSSSSQTEPVHEYLNPGMYVVTLTTNGNSGCSSVYKDTIQVYPIPTADFYPTVYETSVNSQELKFIYSGIGGIEFFWDFGDGTTASGPSPTQNYFTAGNYEVKLTVWNQYGCEASSEIEEINVKEYDGEIFVPTAFSPNSDNLNEKFYIVSENVASAYFAVYNRWGELVYESNDITQGWDGTHNGQPLNPDVFVFYLKGVFYDGESFIRKGNITLVK